MKSILTITLLVLATIAFGQPENNAKIETKLTSEHVNIKGTKISLVPPQNWTISTTFDGFQQDATGASIMLIELEESYAHISQAFTAEVLEPQGVMLDEEKTLTVNGYSATYMVAKQLAAQTMFRKYVLVFGDENITYMLNGVFPLDFEENLGEKVVKSMLSVVYEPNKTVDSAPMSFELDASGLKLKQIEPTPQMLKGFAYSVDGKMPRESEIEDETFYMIALMAGNFYQGDKKQYSLDRINSFPLVNDLEVKTTEAITVDGISGYEITAYGNNAETEKPTMIYQVTLFSDTSYYVVTATTRDDFEKNLEQFKKLTRTFSEKS